MIVGTLTSGTNGTGCLVINDLSGRFLTEEGGLGASSGFSAACKEIGLIEGGKIGFGGGGGRQQGNGSC